jgi:hypothetical protein
VNKVGDNNVSPYLTQRLRTIEEVQAERERHRQALGGNTQTPTPDPPPAPTPPKAEPAAPPGEANANRPGRILDEKA